MGATQLLLVKHYRKNHLMTFTYSLFLNRSVGVNGTPNVMISSTNHYSVLVLASYLDADDRLQSSPVVFSKVMPTLLET
jgi:hypothetical protein